MASRKNLFIAVLLGFISVTASLKDVPYSDCTNGLGHGLNPDSVTILSLQTLVSDFWGPNKTYSCPLGELSFLFINYTSEYTVSPAIITRIIRKDETIIYNQTTADDDVFPVKPSKPHSIEAAVQAIIDGLPLTTPDPLSSQLSIFEFHSRDDGDEKSNNHTIMYFYECNIKQYFNTTMQVKVSSETDPSIGFCIEMNVSFIE